MSNSLNDPKTSVPEAAGKRVQHIVGGPLMKKLSEWIQEGNRSIDIKVDSKSVKPFSTQIWVWDFDMESGKFINLEQDIPTKKDLTQIKIDRLETELDKAREAMNNA